MVIRAFTRHLARSPMTDGEISEGLMWIKNMVDSVLVGTDDVVAESVDPVATLAVVDTGNSVLACGNCGRQSHGDVGARCDHCGGILVPSFATAQAG